MGLNHLNHGRILIDNHLATSQVAKKKIITVMRDSYMNQGLTARQNIEHYMMLRNGESHNSISLIDGLARKFLLHEDLDEKVRNLSMGIRRGIETIEPLIVQPEYFMLYDLTAHYPEFYLKLLPKELENLANKGTGILTYVTSIEIAKVLADRIDFNLILIDDASLVLAGSALEVLTTLPQHTIERFIPKFGEPEEVIAKKAIRVFSDTKQPSKRFLQKFQKCKLKPLLISL